MHVIIKTRYFYGPKEHRTLLEDDISGETMRFATAKEARAYIEKLDRNIYYCAHGEYHRPTYRVCRIDRLPKYLAEAAR
jgi:hypothetical protein